MGTGGVGAQGVTAGLGVQQTSPKTLQKPLTNPSLGSVTSKSLGFLKYNGNTFKTYLILVLLGLNGVKSVKHLAQSKGIINGS